MSGATMRAAIVSVPPTTTLYEVLVDGCETAVPADVDLSSLQLGTLLGVADGLDVGACVDIELRDPTIPLITRIETVLTS